MAMDTEGMPYREVEVLNNHVRADLTIRVMTAQIREVNIAKGWRAPGGGMCPGQTFGDYIALAHSELSEALEAYRDHRLEDVTAPLPSDDAPKGSLPKPEGVGSEFADLLIRLLDMADVFGIDLEREYVRKLAYNRTRGFQHGGRTLADQEEVRHFGDEFMTPVCEDWDRKHGATVVTADAQQVNCPACGQKIRAPGSGTARPAPVRKPLDVLLDAIPDDQQNWWTCCDVDDFLSEWRAIGLPGVVLQAGSGAQLTLWVADVERVADLMVVGTQRYGVTRGFELTKGAYTVCVLERKETKDA